MKSLIRFMAAQHRLWPRETHPGIQRANRWTVLSLRVLQGVLALLLAMMPGVGLAQVGREFVAIEAYVGAARFVHVGKIVEFKPIEYGKPLEGVKKLGKPYRLVFEVGETIRGEEVKRLELVLSLQDAIDVEYMREHSVEIMLVGGATCRDSYRRMEIGIEEQGKPVEDERYQFHVLDPIPTPESSDKEWIAVRINKRYDFARMFTNELEVVAGRDAILKRARVFAKQHADKLSVVSLRVPNEFGALCGNPEAFCTITLPLCAESKTILARIKDDPGLILRRIKSEDEDRDLSSVLVASHKALRMFPAGNLASGEAELSQLAPDSPGEWVDSDNGDLSLRLGLKSARLAIQESIVIVAEIRNNRDHPITILRPLGNLQLLAHASQIRLWSEQGLIKYNGPIADYDLNKTSFMTLEAKEIATGTLELTVRDFPETGRGGNYAVRYDYSYHGDFAEKLAKEGVKQIWHGTMCSREVRLKKVEGAATAIPSREQLNADLQKLLQLFKSLEERPDDPTPRKEAAALAKRLAPHLPGNQFVWAALIKTRTLKDGMSLAEAEELLGPPSQKSERSVGWYFNPKNKHVAPYLQANIWEDGLAEWRITNR